MQSNIQQYHPSVYTFYESHFSWVRHPSYPGQGHGLLTCHMTQFERSDWLRSENFTNIMIEYSSTLIFKLPYNYTYIYVCVCGWAFMLSFLMVDYFFKQTIRLPLPCNLSMMISFNYDQWINISFYSGVAWYFIIYVFSMCFLYPGVLFFKDCLCQ